VSVNYHEASIVDAYLLAYFPHSVAMAQRAFATIPCERYRLIQRRPLRVVVLGGGPLPEIVGLAERLAACAIVGMDVEMIAVDSHAEPWRDASMLACRLASDLHGGVGFRATLVAWDAREPFPDAVVQRIGEPDMIIFQNCLNEIISGDGFTANCRLLARSLPQHGSVVVCDFSEYEEVHGAVVRLNGNLADLCRAIRPFEPTEGIESPFSRPPPKLFYQFYGAARVEDQPGRYEFPTDCIPRKNLRSSVAVWEKL
jgi:hypothetical protein